MASTPAGVVLRDGRPASSVFHSVLAQVCANYPEIFSDVSLPDGAGAFRKSYGQHLPLLEAARVGGPHRLEVARQLVAALHEQVGWQDEQGECSLAEALQHPAEPLALNSHQFDGAPGWQPVLLYRGERWADARLTELGSDLVARGMVTAAVGQALDWAGNGTLPEGRIDLSGRRIVLLGAGAEMAPTRFWLEAGADVLWLDVAPPPAEWQAVAGMSGRLWWPEENVDLLARPQAVLATIQAFAAGQPLDLGLYAYAPGRARELLLTATMNAIVAALPDELLASVTLLVSPTTPTALTEADQAAMAARLARRPGWESALAALGLFGRGDGAARAGSGAATRSVVAIQGASYQAAQYLGKVLIAECWAADRPFRISANTAAITRTRSLNHPVFAAAFGGAAAFGVETFAPRLSRRLNGLLAVHDWLGPDRPEPGRVRVHGGIHTLPYPLDPPLRVAAGMGFARSPRLLRGLLGRG